MIKAAFFDIDGTLIGFKTHRVPESAWRAIEAMRERGIKVCIASGRSTMEMQDEVKTGFDAYVTMNGQLCYDADGVFRDVHIDDEDVRVLVEQAREGLYDLYVMQGSRSFVNHAGDRVLELGRQVGLDYELGDLDWAYERPVYQFNVFGDRGIEDVFLSRTGNVAATRWNDLFCDVPRRAARTTASARRSSVSGSRPRRPSRSATARTTWACSRWSGRASPWGTPGTASRRVPATSRPTWMTTESGTPARTWG